MALESTRISTSNCPSLAGSTIDPPFNVSDRTGTKQIGRSCRTFLQQKRLVPLQGFELNSLRSCRIALLFCLPVLELGLEWLDGFHEVLIYPAPFVVDDEWEDDIGLVHNQRIVQSGQSWQQGPIVLNWLDIQDSFDASGFNLIIHEVAHKLDTRNGDRASGVPFISLREVAGWEHDLHAAMNNIQEEIELVGENAASIDAYAASDPAECFAVLSEYFFSAPELLLLVSLHCGNVSVNFINKILCRDCITLMIQTRFRRRMFIN